MKEGDVYVFKAVDDNPNDGPKFVSYFVLNNEFLGIRFEADTYDDAYLKALTMFEETREKREATRARIEEGRIKAAETRAKKKIVKSET